MFAPQKVKLGEKEKKILEFCREPKSSREILDCVGVSYHSKNMNKYISTLLDGGLLYYTIPETPFFRKQKYFTLEENYKKVSEGVSGKMGSNE